MSPGRTVVAPAPNLCLVAFRLWLVAGAAILFVSNSFSVTTPAGPLAAWLVAMPLACLLVLGPCRTCVSLLRLAAPSYARVRPQARRLRRDFRTGSRFSPG